MREQLHQAHEQFTAQPGWFKGLTAAAAVGAVASAIGWVEVGTSNDIAERERDLAGVELCLGDASKPVLVVQEDCIEFLDRKLRVSGEDGGAGGDANAGIVIELLQEQSDGALKLSSSENTITILDGSGSALTDIVNNIDVRDEVRPRWQVYPFALGITGTIAAAFTTSFYTRKEDQATDQDSARAYEELPPGPQDKNTVVMAMLAAARLALIANNLSRR